MSATGAMATLAVAMLTTWKERASSNDWHAYASVRHSVIHVLGFDQCTPKVCNRLAQGNALGTVPLQIDKALKGRNNKLFCTSCAALTGLDNDCAKSIPRALPWADLFDAFGVAEQTITRIPYASVSMAPFLQRTTH
jgi:hypothetical protein